MFVSPPTSRAEEVRDVSQLFFFPFSVRSAVENQLLTVDFVRSSSRQSKTS